MSYSCWQRPLCQWSVSQDGREICKDRTWRHRLHQAQDQCIGNGGHVFLTQSPKRKLRNHYLLTKESLQSSDHQAENIIRTTNKILWNEHVRSSHARGCKVPLIQVNNVRDKTRDWSALTTSVTDLNTSLTNMKRNNFTHCGIKIDGMALGEETWSGEDLWQQILLFPFKDNNSQPLQWHTNIFKQWRHRDKSEFERFRIDEMARQMAASTSSISSQLWYFIGFKYAADYFIRKTHHVLNST